MLVEGRRELVKQRARGARGAWCVVRRCAVCAGGVGAAGPAKAAGLVEALG